MATVTILEEVTLDGFSYNATYGAYHNLAIPSPCILVDGETYAVVWDGTEYARIAYAFTAADGAACVGIGNTLAIGGENSGEPFCLVHDTTNDYLHYFSTDTSASHTVAIYQEASGEGGDEEPTYAPNDVIIKRYSGEDQLYQGVNKVHLTHANGVDKVSFSYGEAVENVPITLDLADGDQTVTAEDGTLIKSAIITKPDDLAPENVRYGKEIAGVPGEFIGDTEEVTVGSVEGGDTYELNLAVEDLIIEPSAPGKVISKITIRKPETLIPSYIAKDVNIAGVAGAYEGGGGTSDFYFSDEYLKFFTYQIDTENKQIILYSILYAVLYETNGSYDVEIPNKIGGYDVVIAC